MAKIETLREPVDALPTAEQLRARSEAGWQLVALEWQRQVAAEKAAAGEEVPFGLRVAPDAAHLEADPAEHEVLELMLEMMIDDETSVAQVAETLNSRGFRTRRGKPWTAIKVFNLLPRLVEAAPRIYASRDWPARRLRRLASA